MPNLLAGENSPYLLQHSHNPVDWYPWGPEALQRARAEDKPIFLSIGYAACHWCHVMAHESFEDPATAALMNAGFINIKVDREERPDLDQVYMQAVVAISGSGGWPMSVFLTPEGMPFYGGTYYPPAPRYNIPSFTEILQTISRLWKEDRVRLVESSQQIIEHIHRSQFLPTFAAEIDPALLEKASLHLAQSYDWKDGGWGKAPKFPQPMAIEFMLRRSMAGDRMALDVSTHALQAMVRGGMYDLLGGGFSRYSTDDRWLIPHFEKMLYDNAQLARVYLHAFMITGEPFFQEICEQTLDFMLRELSDHRSGDDSGSLCFYSSLDADSEGVEGKYYVWNYEEVQQALAAAQNQNQLSIDLHPFALFQAAYTFSEQGNFEGHNVLHRKTGDQSLSDQFGYPLSLIHETLRKINQVLLDEREKRIRPGLDDKSLAAWNAMALSAFAEAARYLKRDDYLEAARKNAHFLLTRSVQDGRLMRSWRLGRARSSAYLEDHAGLVLALISLYQSDPDLRWYTQALQLTEEMLRNFSDPEGGFFDTSSGQEQLILRSKDLQDNATPSGNSQAATALLIMAAYTGSSGWRVMAEKMLASIQETAAQYPTGFAQWLCALDYALHQSQEVALLGEISHPITRSFVDILWKKFRPYALVAMSAGSPGPGNPPLLLDKTRFNQLPTAFVCKNFTCQLPTNDPQEFERQLHGQSL
ncbi:MAG: hypothetical protein A2Z16_03245 [Chloroflexi bacterium RBG_16_54_18]|nr:MAG: hypothetical protein A2Z16_03245 [Chloroflexi bacterium RBG_16_54_18]